MDLVAFGIVRIRFFDKAGLQDVCGGRPNAGDITISFGDIIIGWWAVGGIIIMTGVELNSQTRGVEDPPTRLIGGKAMRSREAVAGFHWLGCCGRWYICMAIAFALTPVRGIPKWRLNELLPLRDRDVLYRYQQDGLKTKGRDS